MASGNPRRWHDDRRGDLREPVSTLVRLNLPDVWVPEPDFHLPQRAG